MRRIKLTKNAPVETMFQNYGAYRLRIEASDAEGEDIDNHIFIFKRNPASPYNSEVTDTFEGIAGPVQLSSMPIDEPDAEQNWPYYRSDKIVLDFGSTQEAEDVWNEIKADVAVLIEALNRLDILRPVEEVWFPTPPDASESASV